MAFYARKCKDCTNSKKKCLGTQLKDESGKLFCLQMYECQDMSCQINRSRAHGRKELHLRMGKLKGVLQTNVNS